MRTREIVYETLKEHDISFEEMEKFIENRYSWRSDYVKAKRLHSSPAMYFLQRCSPGFLNIYIKEAKAIENAIFFLEGELDHVDNPNTEFHIFDQFEQRGYPDNIVYLLTKEFDQTYGLDLKSGIETVIKKLKGE